MPDYFDRNDTRPSKSREAALFRNLKTIIAIAKPRAAGLRRILRDHDLASVGKRDELARLPVLRRFDLERMRAEEPPFGGLVAARVGALRCVFPHGPQGHAPDWWSAARALAAAGFAKGDVILNCFSYHLSADGHMVQDGALSLGCAVIPAGTARVERKLETIHQMSPTAFCGEPDELVQLLEHARDLNRDVSSLRKAFVFGRRLSPHARAVIEARGIRVREALATPELGVIAYETDRPDGERNDGMIVNEGLILEILRPGENEPAREGETGEIVVTRVNPDYPLLRYATGDLSRVLPGPSPCGRTATRIAGWLGRADEIVRSEDRAILPEQVIEIGRRNVAARHLQLVVAADRQTLRVDAPGDDAVLLAALAADARDVLGREARIEIVAPGVLTDKSRLIVEERR